MENFNSYSGEISLTFGDIKYDLVGDFRNGEEGTVREPSLTIAVSTNSIENPVPTNFHFESTPVPVAFEDDLKKIGEQMKIPE